MFGFFKKKPAKPTMAQRLNKQEERIRKYLDDFIEFRKRFERLYTLYPNTINSFDFFIAKHITLVDDKEIPDEFLCSCKLLGLKVENVKRNIFFINDEQGFYYVIMFKDELRRIECDE